MAVNACCCGLSCHIHHWLAACCEKGSCVRKPSSPIIVSHTVRPMWPIYGNLLEVVYGNWMIVLTGRAPYRLVVIPSVIMAVNACCCGLLECANYGPAPTTSALRTGRKNINSKQKEQPVINMMHWNAEGVSNKRAELQHFLHENNVNICCIQETHLQDDRLHKTKLRYLQ
jgi:hypothetical protein